ncbi:hypothetical protein M117_1350 [Bacteroides fragilis str. 3774 T13]|nr:hypothetical protein M117_1350 [Bacteroides fragilis str. 3774 T13]
MFANPFNNENSFSKERSILLSGLSEQYTLGDILVVKQVIP